MCSSDLSNAGNKRLAEYLASDRGRAYIRSTLRRTSTIESIIDRWIAAHPAYANVRHTEDQPVFSAELPEPDPSDVAVAS